MAIPLDENFENAYSEENLTPNVAGDAASMELAFVRAYNDDCSGLGGASMAETPRSFSNYSGDVC
jgi:hypothetical protein